MEYTCLTQEAIRQIGRLKPDRVVVVDAFFGNNNKNHKILVKNKQGTIYMCPPLPAEQWRALLDKLGTDLNHVWILIEKDRV